jgi:hypothetical protein
MTAVGYVVKSMLVEIDQGGSPVEYQCAVRGVTDAPTVETQTTRVACPDGVKNDSAPPVWTVTIDYNVSNVVGSLHRLLRENFGAAAVLTIEPFPLEEPGITVVYNVTLTPAGAAYVVGQFGQAQVVLPVTGAPVTTDPVVV